jgi:hypothetical protein
MGGAVGAAWSGSRIIEGSVRQSGVFIGACVIDATVASLTPTTVRFSDFSVKFSFVFDGKIKKAKRGAINGWAAAGY